MYAVLKHRVQNLQELVKNKWTVIPLVVGFILNIILWLFIYLKISPQDDLVFLHYNIYFGVDLIGDWYRMYLMPLLGVLIIFINIVLSVLLKKRDNSIRSFIGFVSIGCQCILMWAAYLIIQQNN